MSESWQMDQKSFARDCGVCFGHILKAIRTPVAALSAPPAEVRTIGARVLETPDGAIIRRRIVIDQIIQRDSQLPPALGPIS
ncbi:MAG: hypothetical protein EXS17_05805 [Phycisphaerales bacterium]|nr:hypothetical protein [Phycisphaerales bacterium]